MVETPKKCPNMVQMTHLGEGRLNFGKQCPVEERSMVLRDSIQFHPKSLNIWKMNESLTTAHFTSFRYLYIRQSYCPWIEGRFLVCLHWCYRYYKYLESVWVWIRFEYLCQHMLVAIGYPTAKKWPTFSWQWMSTCCWGTLWSTGYAGTLMNSCQCIYCENLSWGNQVTH